MKDWVLPFLREKGDSTISIEQLEMDLSTPTFCFRRLSKCFNINSTNFRLVELFGSVLADLPEDVFQQLLCTRNLFFSFNDRIAFVQAMNLVEFERTAILCVFSEELLKLNDSSVRGTISHELAHIILGHYKAEVQEMQTRAAMEGSADRLAEAWGFSYEILKIREYLQSKPQI